PDAQATQCDEHEHTRADLADVEAVDAEDAEEEAEQGGGEARARADRLAALVEGDADADLPGRAGVHRRELLGPAVAVPVPQHRLALGVWMPPGDGLVRHRLRLGLGAHGILQGCEPGGAATVGRSTATNGRYR